jgi:hypothetical protein
MLPLHSCIVARVSHKNAINQEHMLIKAEQLQKMGILKSKPSHQAKPSIARKRNSLQGDFANLKPLTPGGTKGFHGLRDNASPTKGDDLDDMESDEENPEKDVIREVEGEDFKEGILSPEDAKKQGELAEGVKKIKVSVQNSLVVMHANRMATAKTSTLVRAWHCGLSLSCTRPPLTLWCGNSARRYLSTRRTAQ